MTLNDAKAVMAKSNEKKKSGAHSGPGALPICTSSLSFLKPIFRFSLRFFETDANRFIGYRFEPLCISSESFWKSVLNLFQGSPEEMKTLVSFSLLS